MDSPFELESSNFIKAAFNENPFIMTFSLIDIFFSQFSMVEKSTSPSVNKTLASFSALFESFSLWQIFVTSLARIIFNSFISLLESFNLSISLDSRSVK